MSAPTIVRPGISEAELIEMESHASAIGVAEELIIRKMAEKEAKRKLVPYSLKQALERLEALRGDMRRLIELARRQSR